MCIVLDYASGGELFEFVADKRAIASEADIQFIFAQIVDGTVSGTGIHAKNANLSDVLTGSCLVVLDGLIFSSLFIISRALFARE